MTTINRPTSAKARPRVSTLDRATLMRLAAAEYEHFAAALEKLDTDDWSKSTECAGWDVRTMASHVLGMAEMAAFIPEGIRQMRAAKKRGGLFIDALTAVQVEKRTEFTPAELIARIRVVGPKAARGRRRIPDVVRNRRLPIPQPVGDVDEDWTIGFLMDTILTRDTWMHRIDISRATGQPLELTVGHDDVLVADVVDEWASRHGKPCQLHLTGEAGGTWTFGDGGPGIDLDAIDFNRTLSGREPATDLLAVAVPY
jgi:uncharacterized protein (TIGR03083 family)